MTPSPFFFSLEFYLTHLVLPSLGPHFNYTKRALPLFCLSIMAYSRRSRGNVGEQPREVRASSSLRLA